MKRIYKITFYAEDKNFYFHQISNKLHDMSLSFHAARSCFNSDWMFSVEDITAEQKKVICNFLRKLFNNNKRPERRCFYFGRKHDVLS